MTKKVLVASVVALFVFAGCSQQTAKPAETKGDVNVTVEATPAPVVEKVEEEVQIVEEEVQIVEEEVATPHSMKEVAVETVQTVK